MVGATSAYQEDKTILTNVSTIKQGSYYQALKFNIRSGGNLLVLGMAGTGKTEMAQQAVAEEGYEAIYLNLSVLEYPDLVGLQTISTDPETGRKFVEYAAPKFLPLLPKNLPAGHKKKVIILDELDKAKDELQNPLLELLQFHTINGSPVDVHAFILTGNLPDEGAFSRPISHALTNRCMVYQVTHEFNTWMNWAVENNINPLIVGFLSRNQEYLSRPAIEGDPTAYCRESPRSWSMAARDLDITQKSGRSTDETVQFQTMLVAGRVGVAAALKFQVWLDHYRHIENVLDDLVKEGKHPNMSQMTLDRQIVLAISACSAVTSLCMKEVSAKDKEKHRKEVDKMVENVFGWVSKLSSDLQIAAAKSTMNIQHISEFGLTKSQVFMKTFTNIKAALGDR